MLNKSLNYLIPNKINDLIRLGNKKDAGYVVSQSALNNCNCLVSFGMAENLIMENDFFKLSYDKKIHMYDHTINNMYFYKRIYKSIKRLLFFKSNFKNILSKLKDFKNYKKIINNNKIKHFKEKIGLSEDNKVTDLTKVISRLESNDKIFLKSDIEGDEFKFLKDLTNKSDQIHLLVTEFHFLDKNREEFKKTIIELKKKFHLIHLHENNYSSYCDDGLPKVLEISFINKKYYNVEGDAYNLSFPIKNLDFPNIEHEEDLEFSFII